MTDLDCIVNFVDDGEVYGSAPYNMKAHDEILERDVYYIRHIGKATGGNIDFLYRVCASTRKKLIVAGIVDMGGWVEYFNRIADVWMEIDDNTVIFDKTF